MTSPRQPRKTDRPAETPFCWAQENEHEPRGYQNEASRSTPLSLFTLFLAHDLE